MIIERKDKEIIIRLQADIDIDNLQNFFDYLSYKEATAGSKAKQSEVDKLAKSVNKGWWKKHKQQFIK
jgi:hypothetical protein